MRLLITYQPNLKQNLTLSQGTPGADGPPGRDGAAGVKVKYLKFRENTFGSISLKNVTCCILVFSNRVSVVTPDLLVPLELPVPLAPLDQSDPLASKETEEKP